jgi:hypothetical protein
MSSSCEVTSLMLAENRQGLVDFECVFSSPLPRTVLVKKFFRAKNLVEIKGFSHVMLIHSSIAGTLSECCSSECHIC